MKTCSECDQTKAETEFTSKDDRMSEWCNKCIDFFDKFIAAQVKFICVKAAHEGVDCNLTISGIKELFFKQGGWCAISEIGMTFTT
uniref:Uncharacterized protein n=1 Tax=Pithovirus LCPAC404 TaxID=2506597 RepID=A0A481ZFV6_9VIRU|nr:MAG: hypothetical protein LCPAC404_00250 [Pithovirus LCPAC404]